MNYENRRYLIIPITMVDQVNFDQVLESSPETLRKSIDGTKTFVKYNVNIIENDITETQIDPESGQEITTTIYAGIYGRPSIYTEGMVEYTHSEILTILSTSEWTSNEII